MQKEFIVCMNKILKFTLFIIVFISSKLALSATIVQVKGDKVLIDLAGDQVSVGQKIGFKNSDNKTVCIAEVTQAKGSKAIAVIKKGKLTGDESIFYSKAAATPTAAPEASVDTEESISPDKLSGEPAKGVYRLNGKKVAILLTAGMNNMTTKQADSQPTPNLETVQLVGNSFGLAGSLDLPLTSWLIAHATLGYEPFVAAGSATYLSCDSQSSRDCNANINYISAGGFARFNLTKSRFQMWMGLGGTAKFPVSKTSTALNVNDVKMTVTFAGAFGADYFISNKTFVPVSLEYQMFQSSDTVSANTILIRGGYGWAF